MPRKPTTARLQRAPRTQAQRRAETRDRLLAATVETIGDIGFQRTTASEITRRSGVTWGAVQHHFGDKEGMLGAVLENSYARFATRLDKAATRFDETTPLAERISVFIDSAWEHYSSAHYRATFEILLHEAGAREAAEGNSWQETMLRAWSRVWHGFFPDVELTRKRHNMLQHYTISVLSGLASMHVLSRDSTRFVREQLELLKRTLLREFADDARCSA